LKEFLDFASEERLLCMELITNRHK